MKLIFEYRKEKVSGHVKDSFENNDEYQSYSNNPNDSHQQSDGVKKSGSAIYDPIDNSLIRETLPIPDLAEATVVRHYTNLSRFNYGIDVGFYPLGSCTMKYNPKINEVISNLEGFKHLHPYSSTEFVQGSLKIMWELEEYLKELTGMDSFSLQPSAGAQAELLGLLISKSYFGERREPQRSKVIIPDSAHGSNPASASMVGYQTISVPTDTRGNMDFTQFKAALDRGVAVVMLTNPNTLGLYEEEVLKISDAAHQNGTLMYCDGANMNALLGVTRPADQGFDMIHLNLHKTFSAPHGGGGPGAGVLGVRSYLSEYLPVPRVRRRDEYSGLDSCSNSNSNSNSKITENLSAKADREGGFCNSQQSVDQALGINAPERNGRKKGAKGDKLERNPFVLDTAKQRRSVGRIKCFYGNFGTIVRAYSYIRSWGSDITKVSEGAILNANYLMSLLKDVYELPFNRPCAHEFVLTSKKFGNKSALGIAKRLLDYGYHPPTIYFPLIVKEALMIEPTETESKQTLDEFAEALIKIAKELETDPELLQSAPHTSPVGRLDEVLAARNPNLRWKPGIQ